jgi:glutamate synthase domain-containing protein 1
VTKIMAPPLWEEIERMKEPERSEVIKLRQIYGSLLVNGPFAVVIAHHGEMIGLNDRIRLRPMTAGIGGENLYISSEEASIRLVCPELDEFWSPQGGDPIVGKVKRETPALYAPVRPEVLDEDRAGLKVGGLI